MAFLMISCLLKFIHRLSRKLFIKVQDIRINYDDSKSTLFYIYYYIVKTSYDGILAQLLVNSQHFWLKRARSVTVYHVYDVMSYVYPLISIFRLCGIFTKIYTADHSFAVTLRVRKTLIIVYVDGMLCVMCVDFLYVILLSKHVFCFVSNINTAYFKLFNRSANVSEFVLISNYETFLFDQRKVFQVTSVCYIYLIVSLRQEDKEGWMNKMAAKVHWQFLCDGIWLILYSNTLPIWIWNSSKCWWNISDFGICVI
jgi:hypothetical protein